MGFFDSTTKTESSGKSKIGYDPLWRQGYSQTLGMAMDASGQATPWTPTVADRSEATLGALEMLQDRAAGSPLEQVAQQQAMATLGNEYLGANPYLDAMAERATRKAREGYLRGVMPGITARFGAAGGQTPALEDAISRANQDFATELTGSMANLYGGAYETERNRQLGMSQMAPALAGMDYRNIAAMQSAGAAEDIYQNALLAQERERTGWDVGDLWKRIGLLQAGIGGPLQTGSKYKSESKVTHSPSGFQNLMGGIGMGQNLASLGGSLLSAGGAGLLSFMNPGPAAAPAAAAAPYQYYGMSPNQLNAPFAYMGS